jgi:hypothetical protein
MSMTGHREGHALEHHRVRLVGQGVAGAGVLQAHEGGDVAGEDLLDLLALVGMHLEHAADALLWPLVVFMTMSPCFSTPA